MDRHATAKLTEIATALAVELGHGWEYAAGEEYEHRRGCTREDGAGIFVLSNGKRGRFTVAPDYHTAAPTFAMWARELGCPGSITVAADRPVAAIVKDIRRRLVGPYLQALRAMKARQFDRNRQRRKAGEAAEGIKAILGGEIPKYSHGRPASDDSVSVRFHDGTRWGEFTVGDTDCMIELRHIPNELAARIAALLRGDD